MITRLFPLMAVTLALATSCGSSKGNTSITPSTPHKTADVASIQAYFRASLASPRQTLPSPPSGIIAPSQLEAARKTLWAEWQKANQATKGNKLPAPSPISPQMSSSVWTLPDETGTEGTFTAHMPFYYGYKGERPSSGYPLFLYLHGSGAKDAEWQNGKAFAGHFKDGPSMYFVPQIPNEGSLYRWWQRSKLEAWETLLREAFLTGQIDPLRIYFFGISEGGYGSQRLASYYADYLAGAGPMAGGEPLINAPVENCQHIAFTLRTGMQDRMFHRDELTRITKEAFEAQQRLFPNDYQHWIELIPGQGHAIPYEPTTPWLLGYKRNPQPKSVHWEDFPVDGIYRRGFYNLEPLARPQGTERVYYEEQIEGNTITLRVRSVQYKPTQYSPHWSFPMRYDKTYAPITGGKLRLYLSEELINLSQPIRVVLNGKEVYNARASAHWQALATSCVAFGDPLRLFPIALELSY
ncbi:hypothetical protein [Porphyromonas catoniae]|jgi:hypothetical protein|uniref:hypothetical protein n=1 Tax=Porphyromonas catoniae TaxID=41976 RepID=UPI0028D5AB96|nr:hypothetical protein [Porphyromonas catoniae]